MSPAVAIRGPEEAGGHQVWRSRLGSVHVRFTGRGPAGEREDVLRRVTGETRELAWARQTHSTTVLQGRPGACGEGDALWTDRAGLVLSVVTADCVPVVLAGPEGMAAVHAGWRGLVDGVLPATLDRLPGPLSAWTAWIGPAIGVCCYEVGEEVAKRVTAVGGPEVAVPGPAGKPHLDLPGVARRQLTAAGVGTVLGLVRCTRCDAERLYSYRREGKGAGRNIAFIWREPAAL
ncbi:MAG TPA: multi-copper polyphenol oxidoreductase [Acidobacteria bacterium]|nr:multi-copper polyphenol oxidoreductase [Acidobacteriota bacterium]